MKDGKDKLILDDSVQVKTLNEYKEIERKRKKNVSVIKRNNK